MSNDEELLMKCDSLLSLILHREREGLSVDTIRELTTLMGPLRKRTDESVRDQEDPLYEQMIDSVARQTNLDSVTIKDLFKKDWVFHEEINRAPVFRYDPDFMKDGF